MAFPIIQNFQGEEVAPTNLLLYNNESNIVFMDQAQRDILTFDLEKGKLVDVFGVGDKSEHTQLRQVVNDVKNGQQEAGGTLLGLSDRGLF